MVCHTHRPVISKMVPVLRHQLLVQQMGGDEVWMFPCLAQAQLSVQLGRSTHIHVLLMAVPHRDLPSLDDVVAVHSSVCHSAHIHAPVLAHLQQSQTTAQHRTIACCPPITWGHDSASEGPWGAMHPLCCQAMPFRALALVYAKGACLGERVGSDKGGFIIIRQCST